MMKEIEQQPDAERIREIPISYEKRWIEKGREIGEEVGIEKVACEMLRKQLPIDLIAEVTHLEKEKIEKLKESL